MAKGPRVPKESDFIEKGLNKMLPKRGKKEAEEEEDEDYDNDEDSDDSEIEEED